MPSAHAADPAHGPKCRRRRPPWLSKTPGIHVAGTAHCRRRRTCPPPTSPDLPTADVAEPVLTARVVVPAHRAAVDRAALRGPARRPRCGSCPPPTLPKLPITSVAEAASPPTLSNLPTAHAVGPAHCPTPTCAPPTLQDLPAAHAAGPCPPPTFAKRPPTHAAGAAHRRCRRTCTAGWTALLISPAGSLLGPGKL